MLDGWTEGESGREREIAQTKGDGDGRRKEINISHIL